MTGLSLLAANMYSNRQVHCRLAKKKKEKKNIVLIVFKIIQFAALMFNLCKSPGLSQPN